MCCLKWSLNASDEKSQSQISSSWDNHLRTTWCHTILLAARHKRVHPALTPASKAGSGTRLTNHGGMKGWVDLGAPAGNRAHDRLIESPTPWPLWDQDTRDMEDGGEVRRASSLTMTRKMFQIKKPGRREARQDVEKAGCLYLELRYSLVDSRFHVSMWLCSFHSCSSTNDCTLMLDISLLSSSRSSSYSDRSDVIVSVKSCSTDEYSDYWRRTGNDSLFVITISSVVLIDVLTLWRAAHCCHTGTAIKHPEAQGWASECRMSKIADDGLTRSGIRC